MSLGSIVSTALLDTLLGMGTVFVILIFISLVISLFRFIPALDERWAKFRSGLKRKPAQPAQVMPAAEAALPGEVIDDQTVAAVTAVINKFIEEKETAAGRDAGDVYVVRSIRRK